MFYSLAGSRRAASMYRPLNGPALYPILTLSLAACLFSGIAVAAEPAASGTASKPKTSGTEVKVADEVVVTGLAKDGSADVGYRADYVSMGPMGSMSVLDVPYSITSVSADLIQNLQAQSVAAALQYAPTVQSQTGGSRLVDYYTVRGFSSSVWSYNTSLDNMRSYDAVVPVEDKERIEILNGANSFLYGITSPAGMVNYVLKRPITTDLYDFTVGNYGGEQYYGHADIGGPLNKSGTVAFRLNLLGVNDGDTGTDKLTNGRYLQSAMIDWHLLPETVLSFSASHFERELDFNQPLFMVGSAITINKVRYPGVTEIPSAPDASKSYGADFGYGKDEINKFGTEFVSKLNDTFTLRSAFQYTLQEREFATLREYWVNNDADYQVRTNYNGHNRITTDQGYAYLDSVFETGPLSHKVTFGASADQIQTWTPYPYGLYNPTGTVVYPSNLSSGISPVEIPTAIEVSNGSPYKRTENSTFTTILLADQIDLTKQWSVMLGGNYASVSTETWDSSQYAKLGYWPQNPTNDKGEFTPSVALMYKPTEKVTTYVSYIQGLQRGDTAPTSAVNAYQVLSPYKSDQWEIGAKAEISGVNLNAALFRIEQAYAYTDPDTLVYGDYGREVHTGVELSASGKLTEDLTLFGGFTVLDPTVEKAASVTTEGKCPQGVAKEMAKVYLEYAVPYVSGLALTGGVSYTGREWVDAANTLSIPSVTVGSVGARYSRKFWNRDVTFRVYVDNVTGKDYWTTRSAILYLGNPRTVSFSAEVKF